MPYLHCGRCSLQIKIRSAVPRPDNCPRCLARSATVSPLTISDNGVSVAVGWGERATDRAKALGDRPGGEEIQPA